MSTPAAPNALIRCVRRFVGLRNLGRLDYLLRRRPKDRWGGPFNGQTCRRHMVEEAIEALSVTALVETGTFLGTTTIFLAKSGLPVYTVEANPRHHAFAELRLRAEGAQVDLRLGDSRSFLRELSADGDLTGRRVLFYLDAHWEEDLPLREELEIVFAGWRRPVVIVDDFQVPGTEYRFDDYGAGNALTLSYLKPLEPLGLQAFFPTAPASEETGAKKGCVVLCRDDESAEILGGLAGLRAHGLTTD